MQEAFRFEKEGVLLRGRGSSVVERNPEEIGVGCSIHPRGTFGK